jgi:hypothetical protein
MEYLFFPDQFLELDVLCVNCGFEVVVWNREAQRL